MTAQSLVVGLRHALFVATDATWPSASLKAHQAILAWGKILQPLFWRKIHSALVLSGAIRTTFPFWNSYLVTSVPLTCLAESHREHPCARLHPPNYWSRCGVGLGENFPHGLISGKPLCPVSSGGLSSLRHPENSGPRANAVQGSLQSTASHGQLSPTGNVYTCLQSFSVSVE